ncbi:DUF5667 domain-containing protein [Intrasporangium flavum]|uniref:DUF5667 domain-containing protein n=1 Tax=Intrasporangium flavum TaxID=1428657 RepID=UPI00096FB811|nr:DUF5667 domain-containing protein [Intrasporangium flavum]
MDLGPTSDADLLQRALDGERVTEPGILELVAVVHAVTAVDQAALAPRREFVADLRARLLEDDGGLAAPVVPLGGPSGDSPTQPLTPTSAPDGPGLDARGDASPEDTAPGTEPGTEPDGSSEGPGSGSGGTVSVLRVAARPLRYLAAAAAALLVVGGALGWASRSALPGDALYGVKQVLDRAAVQLSGSRFDQGLTYLAQAEQHIGEARDLVDRGAPAAGDVETALDLASDSTTRAQTLLLEAYRSDNRADALTELADFYARALPQVDALRSQVPAAALPSWQRLHDLLTQNRVAVLRELATCTACGDRATQARQLLSAIVTGTPSSSATTAIPQPSSGRPTTPAPPATVPRQPGGTVTVPGVGGVPLPGLGVTGGVTLPGSTIQLPGVGVSSSSVGVGGGGVTLPGSTVSLPGVTATSGTIGVGGGGVSITGLPSVPLPSVSLTVPQLPLTPSLPKLP